MTPRRITDRHFACPPGPPTATDKHGHRWWREGAGHIREDGFVATPLARAAHGRDGLSDYCPLWGREVQP